MLRRPLFLLPLLLAGCLEGPWGHAASYDGPACQADAPCSIIVTAWMHDVNTTFDLGYQLYGEKGKTLVASSEASEVTPRDRYDHYSFAPTSVPPGDLHIQVYAKTKDHASSGTYRFTVTGELSEVRFTVDPNGVSCCGYIAY